MHSCYVLCVNLSNLIRLSLKVGRNGWEQMCCVYFQIQTFEINTERVYFSIILLNDTFVDYNVLKNGLISLTNFGLLIGGHMHAPN